MKCVPWIVLQVSCSTRTSGESLRPPKRPSKAKNGQNITFLDISGSVLSDFANFPASPLKREKNAAFGSHVALSVLQIDCGQLPKSSWVGLYPHYTVYIYTKKNSWPKQNVSNSSQIIQWTSVGHITIHIRGHSPIQGPLEGSEAIFWPKNDRFWPPLPTRSNFSGSKCLLNMSHE